LQCRCSAFNLPDVWMHSPFRAYLSPGSLPLPLSRPLPPASPFPLPVLAPPLFKGVRVITYEFCFEIVYVCTYVTHDFVLIRFVELVIFFKSFFCNMQ
jgi:hypothetical protein